MELERVTIKANGPAPEDIEYNGQIYVKKSKIKELQGIHELLCQEEQMTEEVISLLHKRVDPAKILKVMEGE